MARHDEDFNDVLPQSPKRSVAGTQVILAGVAAGLIAALSGGLIWLTFRDKQPTPIPHKESSSYQTTEAMKKAAKEFDEEQQRRENR
ncbi:hypothetical protein [Limnoglobus roseus]|uniref:Uncharacterized protein n=1 Tax=Limnoglobus roseus TaxID=2598579 RepID=A0A5C1AAY4_9BACT|nr:hypothetical protein [Limnoglobus roseus]QEL15880.1 hypothetical protein PX52LOC_02816 [Limnoglobus roseus]